VEDRRVSQCDNWAQRVSFPRALGVQRPGMGAVVGESRHPRGRRQWLLWVAPGTALVVGGVAVLNVQTSRQLKVISLGSSSSVKVGASAAGPA